MIVIMGLSKVHTIPSNFSCRHKSYSVLSVNSNSPGRHKSFTHIENRASAVGREELVYQSPVLIPKKLLPSQWVPGLAPTYFLPRRAEHNNASKYGTKSIRYVILQFRLFLYAKRCSIQYDLRRGEKAIRNSVSLLR